MTDREVLAAVDAAKNVAGRWRIDPTALERVLAGGQDDVGEDD